jgi:putative nucleotidyltransferase with HDIG domain
LRLSCTRNNGVYIKQNKKPFYIRDPVSGDLRLDDVIKDIIETQEFQRLRYVKQLGFAYLIFPGAHHTRFEHSLGTWNITKDISERMLGSEDVELSVAGLLHDIGHMAMSHESETPMYKFTKMMHEEIGRRILEKSPVLDKLSDYGLSRKKVIKYFDGIGKGKVVTGATGTDRLDYLMRDAYYTGVAYGIIDYYRIRNLLTLYLDEPATYSNGIDAIESFFIARYYMYSSVYFHHAVIIANGMYRKALKLALESGEIDPKAFISYRDDEAIAKLSESKASGRLIGMIMERKLFKRAYYEPNFNGNITNEELSAIAEKAGLDDSQYIAEVHPFKGNDESIRVISKEMRELGDLRRTSSMFKILTDVLEKRKVVVVACEQKYVKKLSAAIEKAL